MKGYENKSGLLGSTVAGFGFILVFIFELQNLIKLGREVGLAYQSPPPLYFNKAISWAWLTEEIKKAKIKKAQLDLIDLNFYALLVHSNIDF